MSAPIDKDLDTIREEMYSNIETVMDEYVEKGWLPTRLNLEKGLFRGLIEIWCWGLNQAYKILQAIFDIIDIDNASGLWLEFICRWVQIYRKEKTKAKGNVVFSRDDSSGNCTIKKGRVVKTKTDGNGDIFRYITTGEVVMAAGVAQIEVPVIAESYGESSNVVAGQIVEIVTPIDGIDSVTNETDWITSEGNNEESDDSLRERYKLKWKSSDSCTKYAYEDWALSVTGVKSVKIVDQHPRGEGTIDVIILGSAGLPSQELIDNVTEVISDEAPINDDFLVKSPDQILVDIVAEIEVTEGTIEDAISSGETLIAAFFPLGVGIDLTVDMIKDQLMDVDYAKKVNITSPESDKAADNLSMIVLNSCTITAVLVEA